MTVTQEQYDICRVEDLNKNCDMNTLRTNRGLVIVQIPRQAHLDRFPPYEYFATKEQVDE